MNRAVIAAVCLSAGLSAGLATPVAHADDLGLTCEHRGLDHIQRHGGKTEDDLYHRLHGEQVTCDGKDEPRGDYDPYEKHDPKLHADLPDEHDNDKDNKHDAPLPGHRDKPGYGCFMLRCG